MKAMLKQQNKVLLIVLIILVAIWLGREFLTNKGESNFDNQLLSFDSSIIDKVVITRGSEGEEVNFVKTGVTWEVFNSTIKDEADKASVNGILNALDKLTAERLVSRTESSWKKYEVDEETGTRVQLFNDLKEVADVYLGKSSLSPTSRKSLSFIRINGEYETFAVSGLSSSQFTKDFDKFRDRTFLQTNKNQITGLKFSYPSDSSFSLSKMNDGWTIDNVKADSVTVDTFLNGIRMISKNEFENEFDSSGQKPIYSLDINGDNMTSIRIDAYQLLNEEDDLILHSSLNENAWFRTGTLDIFTKLFPPRSKFE